MPSVYGKDPGKNIWLAIAFLGLGWRRLAENSATTARLVVGNDVGKAEGITSYRFAVRVGVEVALMMVCGGGRRRRPLELLLRRGQGSAGTMCVGLGSKGTREGARVATQLCEQARGGARRRRHSWRGSGELRGGTGRRT
jgi:hypothetical protein